MVNNRVLLVLGFIVLTSMGLGILIGMQLAPPDQGQAESEATTPTRINEVSQTTVRTSHPNENKAPTRTQEKSNSDQFTDRSSPELELSKILEDRINRKRLLNNYSSLTTTGYFAGKLDSIAMSHSQTMANERAAGISINGNTSEDRYQSIGIYDACTFPSNNGRVTITPRLGRMELVSNPVSVHDFENVDEGYRGNPYAVANRVVDNWMQSSDTRQKLMYKNARQLGVGVTITDQDEVYVVASVCGAGPN